MKYCDRKSKRFWHATAVPFYDQQARSSGLTGKFRILWEQLSAAKGLKVSCILPHRHDLGKCCGCASADFGQVSRRNPHQAVGHLSRLDTKAHQPANALGRKDGCPAWGWIALARGFDWLRDDDKLSVALVEHIKHLSKDQRAPAEREALHVLRLEHRVVDKSLLPSPSRSSTRVTYGEANASMTPLTFHAMKRHPSSGMTLSAKHWSYNLLRPCAWVSSARWFMSRWPTKKGMAIPRPSTTRWFVLPGTK